MREENLCTTNANIVIQGTQTIWIEVKLDSRRPNSDIPEQQSPDP